MGKTGHEAEGGVGLSGSGNTARSRWDERMLRPISRGLSCTREEGLDWKTEIPGVGCQGGGAYNLPAQECGAEWVASLRLERQVGYGVKLGPFLSVK